MKRLPGKLTERVLSRKIAKLREDFPKHTTQDEWWVSFRYDAVMAEPKVEGQTRPAGSFPLTPYQQIKRQAAA